MTGYKNVVYVENKAKLHDQSDQVQFVMKTRHDNNMTDRIGAVHAENEIELSWLIRPSAVCDKN